MLTPQTAEWLAGRVTTVNSDRDAQQLADFRAALAQCRARTHSPVERLQALIGLQEDSTLANRDSAA